MSNPDHSGTVSGPLGRYPTYTERTGIVEHILPRQPHPIPQPCCVEWGRAVQDCTDNESYGSAVHCSNEYGRRVATGPCYIGEGLMPVRFCPWCGASKDA